MGYIIVDLDNQIDPYYYTEEEETFDDIVERLCGEYDLTLNRGYRLIDDEGITHFMIINEDPYAVEEFELTTEQTIEMHDYISAMFVGEVDFEDFLYAKQKWYRKNKK